MLDGLARYLASDATARQQHVIRIMPNLSSTPSTPNATRTRRLRAGQIMKSAPTATRTRTYRLGEVLEVPGRAAFQHAGDRLADRQVRPRPSPSQRRAAAWG
jgi:hypothetical protein